MAEVQVSNARRIIFTVLSLVSFWVLAWRIYWMSCDSIYVGDSFRFPLMEFFINWSLSWGLFWFNIVFVLIVASLGLIPSVFLCLSLHNSIFTLRDRWLLIAVLFCVSMYLCWGVGSDDVANALQVLAVQKNYSGAWFPFFAEHISIVRQNHIVSWLSLLTPIMLTTAFVIFWAWRRGTDRPRIEPEVSNPGPLGDI